jgi:hypothetical protein
MLAFTGRCGGRCGGSEARAHLVNQLAGAVEEVLAQLADGRPHIAQRLFHL